MSKKYYHGYKFVDFDLNNIFDFSEKISVDIRNSLTEIFYRHIFQQIIKNLDEAKFFEKQSNLGMGDITSIANYWRDQVKEAEATQERRYLYDVQFILNIGEVENEQYAYVFAEQKKYHEIVKNNSNLCEFGYWNNSDSPDDIPKADWDRREIIWDSFFKRSNRLQVKPIDDSFLVDLVVAARSLNNRIINNKITEAEEEQYHRLFPTVRARAKDIAFVKAAEKLKIPKDQFFSSISRILDESKEIIPDIEKEMIVYTLNDMSSGF